MFLGALCVQGQSHFSRNIEQTLFVPKGQWVVGLSADYSQSKYDNYQFLVVENINGDNYSFKVSPTLCYSRMRTKLNSADIVLSSEDSFDIDNAYIITQNFGTTALLRNYMSIGKSKRFGIINEVNFRYGLSESKISNGEGEDFTGTFMRTHSINVGVQPGLMMFLNNYSALEVNVGVLEFGYSKNKQITDQVHVSNTKTKSANFKVNLFSISIGVAFYL